MNKTPDFDAAADFLAASARVLDRRVFERLFRGGAAEPVRDAVAAYRNADGGFGHALEPDCRAAASQPAAVEMALRIMDLADAWDERLVRDAIDWLATIAPAEGGAAFVEPSVSQGPHAPVVGARRRAPGLADPDRADRRPAVRARVRAPLAGRGHAGDVVADRGADQAERLRDVRRARLPRAGAGPGAGRAGVRAGRRRCCSRPGSSPSTPRPRARRSGRLPSRRCPARSRAACSTRR